MTLVKGSLRGEILFTTLADGVTGEVERVDIQALDVSPGATLDIGRSSHILIIADENPEP